MVGPTTADGFRTTVSALRGLDGSKDQFAHLSLPKNRCVRLLVKNRCTQTTESAVREELEPLDIRVQRVMHHRLGRRDQDSTKERPPIPHLIVSVAQVPEVSRVTSHIEALRSASDGGVVRDTQQPTAVHALPEILATCSVIADTRTRASRVTYHLSVPARTVSVL
jgi:hypothetical protein